MSVARVFVYVLAGIAAAIAVVATLVLMSTPVAIGAEAALPADPSIARWAFASAAAAGAVSAAAASYAVAHVGAAAVGAVTEKPELFGRMLILVGLAEGIAIYGLIVAVLIFNRIGG
jgi:V/A-type H+-transporting ATPase subunit K